MLGAHESVPTTGNQPGVDKSGIDAHGITVAKILGFAPQVDGVGNGIVVPGARCISWFH